MHGDIQKIILTNKKRRDECMKIKNNKRIIYLILVVIWMIIVFSFSNQNGVKSQGSSDIITDKIIEISDDYFALDIKSSEDMISFAVRKLAHFSIYFLGGILIYNFINTFSINKKYIIIFSIVLGAVYACTDELHQLFIDGRSAQMMDVFIDSCGVVLAVIARNKLID